MRCRRCDNEFVFTAAQQRQAFEVRKAYIWQQRTLCEKCWQQRLALTGELRQPQSRWRAQRASLKNDIAALRRWRELLQQLPGYGCRQDVAQIAMLERLLGAEHRRNTEAG
ncbi:zinc-ribbon domain containing protein [Lysobacter capsici]|uniref:zinc-ribbon domain containing protein n=1 Tax=Lysobacter capsici TaxID=435897 RepID=UPI00398D1995